MKHRAEYPLTTPRGAGGGGGHTPTEAADSLRSTQIAEIVDLLGEGEVGGLANGLKSVYLDGVPVENPDGTRNFENVEFFQLTGEPGQDPVDGFTAVQQEVAVGVKVTKTTPVTRTITDTGVDTVRVSVSFPSLSKTEDDGDVKGTSVEWTIEVQSNGGGYIEKYRNTVTGKAISGYKKSVKLELADFGPKPWSVRLKRITNDSTSAFLQDEIWWESYTEIESLKMRYQHSAAAFLKFDARSFSRVPTRGYDMVGISDWLIPTNYNPETRTYTGTWNGNFKLGWTNNPAWIYYNLILNERYGLGKYFPAVDKWQMYELGQWCDEPLDDGKGGTEPRYQINAWIITQVGALQLLQDIAAIWRGAVLFGAGSLGAAWDSPGDPVAQYTPANVVDGLFTYGDGSERQKYSSCTCWWNDQSQLGKRVPVTWQDDALVEKYGLREMPPISPIGVTTPAQALRHAKWALYTQEYEDQTVSFRVGADGVAGRIGEICQISDPSEAGERLGGRINTATTTAVTLDSTVELLAGETYTLCVTKPDPADPTGLLIEERPVTTGAGIVSVLNVFPAFSFTPAASTVWILSANTAMPTLWRYVSIEEVKAESGSDTGEEHTKTEYEITCIAHNPGKWDLIEHGLKVGDRPIRRLPDGASKPMNLNLAEVVSHDGQKFKSQIVIEWEPTAPGQSYLVSWRLNSGAWANLAPTRSWSVDVDLPALGLVEVQVRAQALSGEVSLPLEGEVTAVGNQQPAADVVGLALVLTSKGVVATCNKSPDFDWTTTEFKLDGLDPDGATFLADIAATSYTVGWLATEGAHIVWARHKRRGGPPGDWSFAGIDYVGPLPLLDVLDGRLTEEQFETALQDRLDLIDGDGPGSVNARIEQFSFVGVNMVLGSGFDLDTDGDGVADEWGTFNGGSGDSGRVLAKSLVDALNGGGKAQRVAITSASNSVDTGLSNAPHSYPVVVGDPYTISGWLRTNAPQVYLVARCLNSGGTLVQDFRTDYAPSDQLAHRMAKTFVVPATTATVRVIARGITAAGHFFEVDAIQLQSGEMAGPYMPNPADAAALTAAVNAEIIARVAGDEALAASLTAVSAQVAANSAAITAESVARADADSAQASQITTLQAQMLTRGNNLVRNSSLELDSDADGLASEWLTYSLGAIGTAASSQVAGRRYGFAQRRSATNLGTTANDRIGTRQIIGVTPAAMTQAMASTYIKGTVGATGRLFCEARAAGVLRNSLSQTVALSASWQRLSGVLTVAADVDEIRVFVWAQAKTGGGAVDVDVDDVMLEPGSTLNEYAPGPGDVLGSFAAVMEERTARVDGDAALAASLVVIQAEVDDNAAAIVAESSARASADSAQASQITSLTAKLNAKGSNLLFNSSFELDTDGNGLATNWTAYTLGTVGTAASADSPGRTTGLAQRRSATNLGTTSTDRVGVYQQVNVAIGAFTEMKASVYVKGTTGAGGRIIVEARAGTTVRSNPTANVSLTAGWQRLSVSLTLAADVDNVRFYVFAQAKTGGGAAEIDIDDALLEPGDELNDYSPGPGDAGGAYAAVTEERDARVAEDGALAAMWSIKVDANGRWAGIITRAGAEEATIDLLADVVRIGSTAFSDQALFVVYTSPTVVNGITLPAGVYMRDVYFGTLNGSRIIADTITGTQIAATTINTEHLVVGSASVAENDAVAVVNDAIAAGSTTKTLGPLDVVSLDVTGTPVTSQAVYDFAITLYSLSVAQVHARFWLKDEDGATLDDTGDLVFPALRTNPALSRKSVAARIALQDRRTFTPQTKTLRAQVTAWWYDVDGNAVSIDGVITLKAAVIMQENKV
jgi:predicted phage tail protein